MPRLVILHGDAVHRLVNLDGRDLRIGRGEQNDIVLEDPGKRVSRFHAELRHENGRYVILDLNSQNGVWAKGERVARAVLEPEVAIGIGPFLFILEETAEEPAHDPAMTAPLQGEEGPTALVNPRLAETANAVQAARGAARDVSVSNEPARRTAALPSAGGVTPEAAAATVMATRPADIASPDVPAPVAIATSGAIAAPVPLAVPTAAAVPLPAVSTAPPADAARPSPAALASTAVRTPTPPRGVPPAQTPGPGEAAIRTPPAVAARPAAPAAPATAAPAPARLRPARSSRDPIAWLARQPKPMVVGGFAALALVVVVLGRAFAPSSGATAAPPAASTGPVVTPPPASDEREQEMARHLAEGRAMMARGELAPAIRDHFDRVLVLDPNHPEALELKLKAEEQIRLAATSVGNGSIPTAAPPPAAAPARPASPPAARTGERREPLPPDVPRRVGESTAEWRARAQQLQQRYGQARTALQRGDFAAAIAGFEWVLREEKGYLDASGQLARARDGLVSATREAAARNAGEAMAAGRRFEEAGDLPSALKEYERARDISEGSEAASGEAAERVRTRMAAAGADAYKRARQYDALNRLPEAVALYERVVQLLPAGHPDRVTAQARLDVLRSRTP
jgi:tetratricopeptide (TPR) repeat protein